MYSTFASFGSKRSYMNNGKTIEISREDKSKQGKNGVIFSFTKKKADAILENGIIKSSDGHYIKQNKNKIIESVLDNKEKSNFLGIYNNRNKEISKKKKKNKKQKKLKTKKKSKKK